MFSTDFIFRQQENLVDNQKCQAGFRPLYNKILIKEEEADPKLKDSNNKTAYELALENDRSEVAEYLEQFN